MPEKGAPKWMVTFSDLITLILVFFILLFSMSQIDIVKFKAIAESFKQKQILEFYPSVIPFENPSAAPDVQKNDDLVDNNENQTDELSKVDKGETSEDDSLENLLTDIQEYVSEHDLSDVAVATRSERGVVLVLQEQVLFNSGEATLKKESYSFLNKLAELLQEIPNAVKIEGHTDNRPIRTYKFPSNWELSSSRASSVIRFLIDGHDLDSSRFIAVGYGDTRPIAPNNKPENLQKNRRVELVFLNPQDS